jgi:competence protein ComEC
MLSGWTPYPMVRLLLPFAMGIWWGTFRDWGPSGLTMGLLLVLMAPFLLPAARFRRGFGVLWMVWMFLAGWVWVREADPLRQSGHWLRSEITPRKETRWAGTVREFKRSETWLRLTVALDSLAAGPDDPREAVSGLLLVYVPPGDPGLRVFAGDHLHFSGQPRSIPPPADPLGFDWRFYQRVRGVTHQLFIHDEHWHWHPSDAPPLMGRFQRWRQAFRETLDRYLEEPEARQLARAVILGDREEFSDALNEAYQASGAVHVLAVSGLHVGLVAGMVMGLLGLMLRRRSQFPIKAILATLLIWSYIALTGAADSAVRAGVLFSVLLLGRSLSRQAESLNLLAAAVFLLLLVRPWMIHHIGFQLSVFAVGGILYFQPMLFRSWFPPDRLSSYFWSLFCVTLAAQLGTLMLSLYHFHRFPVYFLLSGLFVVPLAGLFLGAGVATLGLHQVLPALAPAAGWVLERLARLMNALVLGISELPGASLRDLYPPGYWSWLLPLVAGLLLYALQRRYAPSLVGAVLCLALGMTASAALTVREGWRQDWLLIRRQDEGSRLLIRQGHQRLALDLTVPKGEPVMEHWPGWGRVWVLPFSLDFRYGQVRRQDDVLHLGETTLSTGPEGGGQRQICLPGQSRLPASRDSAILLLAPDLDGRLRFQLRKAAQRAQRPWVDLREHGYWQEGF